MFIKYEAEVSSRVGGGERVKCWRRKWCCIYRQPGEDRKVVGWRPMGAKDSRSK